MGTDKRALWAAFYASVGSDGEPVGPDDFEAAYSAGLLVKRGNIYLTDRGRQLLPAFIRAEARALEMRATHWRARADAMEAQARVQAGEPEA